MSSVDDGLLRPMLLPVWLAGWLSGRKIGCQTVASSVAFADLPARPGGMASVVRSAGAGRFDNTLYTRRPRQQSLAHYTLWLAKEALPERLEGRAVWTEGGRRAGRRKWPFNTQTIDKSCQKTGK